MSCSVLSDNTSRDAVGIELQDDDSVIYIPAVDEEEDDNNDNTLVEDSAPLASKSVLPLEVPTVGKSCKRSASSPISELLKSDKKSPRTSFAAILTSPKDEKQVKNEAILICSTPEVTTNALRGLEADKLHDISPIPKETNVIDSTEVKSHNNVECSCASTCKQIQKMVADVHRLLTSDGPLGKLKKLMNLGDAFEKYQLEHAELPHQINTNNIVSTI